MHLNQPEKVKTGFWLLSQNKIPNIFFYLLILFLPTQLGKHFWPNFSFVFGLRLDYLSPTVYLTDVFIILIFLFSFQRLILFPKQVNKNYLIAFTVLLLSLAAGAIGSKNPLAGGYGIIKFLEYCFLTTFVVSNFKSFSKQIIFYCFLAGVIFESLLAFLQYFNQGSINGIFYYFGERAFNAQTPGISNASINGQLFLRPYATFSHPNVLAGFLVMAMLYLLFFLKNKKQKVMLVIGFVLGTACLVLTLSRTAIFLWGVYLIILFGIAVAKKYKNRVANAKYLLGASLILVLIVSLYFVFQNSFVLQRFSLTKLSDESVVERTELISQSLKMFYQNPVFGVGVNNFFNNLSFSNSQLIILLIQPVHNIFLLTLSETGVTGLCFFLYLLYKCLKDLILKKTEQGNKYLWMIFFSIIFLGLFDHYFLTIQQGQLLMSLSIGTILSCKSA